MVSFAGCFEPPRPWDDGISIRHWNYSDDVLSIAFEYVPDGYEHPLPLEYWGFFPAGQDDTPENDNGNIAYDNCNMTEPKPNWLRIHIKNSSRGYHESFYWSDVGCRVIYNFEFFGPGDATLEASRMHETIEHRDCLPCK